MRGYIEYLREETHHIDERLERLIQRVAERSCTSIEQTRTAATPAARDPRGADVREPRGGNSLSDRYAHIAAFHRDQGWRLTPKEHADGSWHSPQELYEKVGKSYIQRIFDTKKKYGYRWKKDERRPGAWWWVLVGKDRTPATSPVLKRKPVPAAAAALSYEEAIG